MECKKCGAELFPDDQFCPECGVKVIRKRRCPECGELYRVGTKFCPECGAETGEARQVKRADSESSPKKRAGSETASRRKTDPAPPPKKRSVYRDEPPRRRRDWEDDDWDDDDDEESVDILTIMTVAVGCILLVVVAVLGFNLYQRYVPKNYEKAAEKQQEEEEGEEQSADEEETGDGQTLEEQQEEETEEAVIEVGGTLVTIADVNIRDNPSTQGTTVIRKAKQGDSYEYIEAVEGGAWYQILLPDEEDYEYGYVSADYIEIP